MDRRRFIKASAAALSSHVVPAPLVATIGLSSGQQVNMHALVTALEYFDGVTGLFSLAHTQASLSDYEILDRLNDYLGAECLIEPDGLRQTAFDTFFLPSVDERLELADALVARHAHFHEHVTKAEALERITRFFTHEDFKGQSINQYRDIVRTRIGETLKTLGPRLEGIDWVRMCEALERNEAGDVIELPFQLLKHYKHVLPSSVIPKIEAAYGHVAHLYDMKIIQEQALQQCEDASRTTEKNTAWYIEPSRHSRPQDLTPSYTIHCGITSPGHAREYLNALRHRLEEFYGENMTASDITVGQSGRLEFQVNASDSVAKEFFDMAVESYKRRQAGKVPIHR